MSQDLNMSSRGSSDTLSAASRRLGDKLRPQVSGSRKIYQNMAEIKMQIKRLKLINVLANFSHISNLAAGKEMSRI